MMEVVACMDGTFDVVCNGEIMAHLQDINDAIAYARDLTVSHINIVVGAFRAVETQRG